MFLRKNSLSLLFGLLFLGALAGQAFAGWADYNRELVTAGVASVPLWEYVTSASFAVDVTENWQSEYLQFLLYIFVTVWLVQQGSPESKEIGKEGTESEQEQLIGPHAQETSPAWAKTGGWRTALFSRSLGLTMGLIFLLSWLVQAVAGWAAFNEQRIMDLLDPVPWLAYVGSADFWNRSLQNWQSEFLAIGSMAVLSIYLRQRGSPESKPTGSDHASTGMTG